MMHGPAPCIINQRYDSRVSQGFAPQLAVGTKVVTMQVFLSKLQYMLFSPSAALADAFLAHATDLADLERREAELEAHRRQNLLALR
jgi:hypothetical protein